MTAQILDGKSIAAEIEKEIEVQVRQWRDEGGPQPGLAVVLVGENPASRVYVRSKSKACQRVGMESQVHTLAPDVPQRELLEVIDQLNQDERVHGILVQLPLPPHIEETQVLDSILPGKDVDAFHPINVGRLSQGRPRFLPCTPHGIQQMLHRCRIEIAGKEVVIVGRSDIVGKPLAMMLAQRQSFLGESAANATVTICHSRTAALGDVTRRADVLIAAIGRPRFITSEMVKPGAAVVDVGINRTDDGLVGDVDFDSVREIAGHLTPVPGGVGPLTVVMLLHNTLLAAREQD